MEPRPRELTFTGERVVPGEVEADLYDEHRARYAYARLLVRGCRVLDAGCGVGYGAALAREGGATVVVGLDKAWDAIAHARRHYGGPGLHFLQGDCTALPLGAAPFDVVVAFEVIEHLADPAALLQEIRRVLKPDGLCLISTPNRRFSLDEREVPNPYHVTEYDDKQFRELLEAVFPAVTLLGQSRLQGFLFQAPGTGETLRLVPLSQPVAESLGRAAWPLAAAQFFVALCGATPETLGAATTALFSTTTGDLVATLKETLAAERAHLRGIIAERERHLEVERAHRDSVMSERERHIALLDAERERLEGELRHVTDATSQQIRELEALLEQPFPMRLIRWAQRRIRARKGSSAA